MNSPRAQVGISRRREVCRREVFTGKITSPPRVRITHDVEVGGAIEMKELPFVLGVLGDFWQSEEALRVLRP
jgi:predicted component of type VI protein secretion system